MNQLALSLDLQRRERDRVNHALRGNVHPEDGYQLTHSQRRTILYRLLELEHSVKALEKQVREAPCPSP